MDLLQQLDTYYTRDSLLAYRHNEDSLSYHALLSKANKLAYYLQTTLQDDKTPIIVYGHKSPWMLVCFLACVKSGRSYCPIDTGVPLQRTISIIEAVSPSIILACEELPYEHDAIMNVAGIEKIMDADGPELGNEYYVHGDDIFYIIFTSGSTGLPKGVQISCDNLGNFVEWSLNLGGIDKQHCTFMNQAPFSFDLSVMDLYTSLASGSTLHALDKEVQKNYATLFQSLKESGTNIWVSTPSFADMCLVDKSFTSALLPELKLFLFCGEILTNDTAQRLLERFPGAKVINTYGPTETTVAISEVDITKDVITNHNPLPIGIAKPGTYVRIVDEQGMCVPDGEKGEIIIVGDTVGKGYFQNEEMTKKAFFTYGIDDVKYPAYHTGDKGYMVDGMLFYSGRMDLQIKLNGYRIEIADIEQNLMKIEHVKHAVVMPNYKDGKIKNLTAVIVYGGDTTQRFQVGQAIAKDLKMLVPDYMVPKKYVFIDTMPTTNNGKADRKALAEVIG